MARSDPSSLQLPHPHSLRPVTGQLTASFPSTGIDDHREVHSGSACMEIAPSSLEAAGTAQVALLPGRTGTLGPVRPGQV